MISVEPPSITSIGVSTVMKDDCRVRGVGVRQEKCTGERDVSIAETDFFLPVWEWLNRAAFKNERSGRRAELECSGNRIAA